MRSSLWVACVAIVLSLLLADTSYASLRGYKDTPEVFDVAAIDVSVSRLNLRDGWSGGGLVASYVSWPDPGLIIDGGLIMTGSSISLIDYAPGVEIITGGGAYAIFPEPTSVLLLGIGGVALLRRRRTA